MWVFSLDIDKKELLELKKKMFEWNTYESQPKCIKQYNIGWKKSIDSFCKSQKFEDYLVGLSIMIRETSSLKISTIATVQISYFLSKKSACHIIFSKRGNDKWLLFSLVTARLAVMVLCVDICAQVWVKYDFRLSSSSVYP